MSIILGVFISDGITRLKSRETGSQSKEFYEKMVYSGDHDKQRSVASSYDAAFLLDKESILMLATSQYQDVRLAIAENFVAFIKLERDEMFALMNDNVIGVSRAARYMAKDIADGKFDKRIEQMQKRNSISSQLRKRSAKRDQDKE